MPWTVDKVNCLIKDPKKFWNIYCSADTRKRIGKGVAASNVPPTSIVPPNSAPVDNLRNVLACLASDPTLGRLAHRTTGAHDSFGPFDPKGDKPTGWKENIFNFEVVRLGRQPNKDLLKPMGNNREKLPIIFVYLNDNSVYIGLTYSEGVEGAFFAEKLDFIRKRPAKKPGVIIHKTALTNDNFNATAPLLTWLNKIFTTLTDPPREDNYNGPIYPGWQGTGSDLLPPSPEVIMQTPEVIMQTPEVIMQKNIILYGPPGTGKTFATTLLALFPFSESPVGEVAGAGVAGVAEARTRYPDQLQSGLTKEISTEYLQLVDKNQIRFVTFHQSFAYEDFVEGISARTSDGKIEYFNKPGVFKKIAAAALASLLNIGLADEESPEELKNIFARAHNAALHNQIHDYNGNPSPYVLIIDEINRGNVAKIFGELITLIETSKRLKRTPAFEAGDHPTGARLPLSGDIFYVPENLYIIGTMNTADRSLVGMDMALRRRFHFVELNPRPELLKRKSGVTILLTNFLNLLNSRVAQFDTPDHAIGHAYFWGVENDQEFLDRMTNSVIPQLRENMIGREGDLQKILSKDGKGADSLVDSHGRRNEKASNIASYKNWT